MYEKRWRIIKASLSNLVTAFSSTERRSKSFYLLAFVPFLLLSLYYAHVHTEFLLGLMIPLYGFLILLLKKHKLFSHPEPHVVQKLFGLVVVFASFFVYFIVSPFFPQAGFYGFANYFVYLIGLFLLFFEIRAFKEAFSPLFLIVASISSATVSDLAGTLFQPYIPNFTSFITNILRATGMAVTQSSSYPNVIRMHTAKGPVSLVFVWACVGFISMYIFSIILVVILSETPGNIKTKIIWSIIGVLGILALNILRIIALSAGYYFYGYEYGETIHSYIGYILFITWSLIFLYLFSKRNTILQKIRRIYAKT